jgi:glutathione synthase/RimK-type ligase-like ATP-grasp enzyme
MPRTLRIGIGKDFTGWSGRFLDAFRTLAAEHGGLEPELVDLEGPDWIEKALRYDVVVWKPSYMGAAIASQLIAKIYTLERIYGRLVVPNFNTIWHFENKIAQADVFRAFDVPTPRTWAAFDYHEARAAIEKEAKFPFVAKDARGAGSSRVWLVRDERAAERLLENTFSHQLWREAVEGRSPFATIARVWTRRWFWRKVFGNLIGEERFRYLYWQEFVPGNAKDLRVTVIGHDRAYAFWRGNRPDDFRASGSGRILYDDPPPPSVISYIAALCRRLDTDSMAFDIVFDKGDLRVTEMSYAYQDVVPHRTGGVWMVAEGKEPTFVKGNVWPQELWARWALERARRAGLLDT